MKLPAALTITALLGAACGSAGPGEPRADVHTGSVAVGDGTLYYEMAGTGAPVILIHGGFGDRRMWDEQFLPLSQAFRMIRYDHRGFGKSPAPTGAYSPAADLLQLMDHLELQRANLVGNSMGGTLALDFALLHPDRTGAVVAIGSTAGGYPMPEESRTRVATVLAAAKRDGTMQAAAQWLQHPMVAVTVNHPRAGPLVRRMVEENHTVLAMDHWPGEPMTAPAFARLTELGANVLFIVGDQDVAPVRDGAQASARRIRRAKLETIPGADHLPQMTEPERVNKLLVDYISLNGC